MNELLCVPCQADGQRHGEDRWRLAVYVLDGESVCDQHAKAMIKVIAERMAGDEHRDDKGQG